MDRHELEVLSKEALIDLILKLQEDKPIGWDTLRELVWERDGPHCQVCGLLIPKSCYDCGHIVDRMAGGSDSLDNLVVMDSYCNQIKPVHRTREEYENWLRDGYWVGELIHDLFAFLDRQRDMLEEHEPQLLAMNPEEMIEILKRDARYRQLMKLGLIDHIPPASEWEERRKNGRFPEWKTHPGTC